MGLIVICDGDFTTLEYLHKNGVFPEKAVLSEEKLSDITPYLTKDDEILFVSNGLTSFTLSSVYSMVNILELHRPKVKGVTIMSNIPLGVVGFDYYLYSGDLFYGSVQQIIKNKVYELDEQGVILEGKKKKGKTRTTEEVKNPISFRFKKYGNPEQKLMLYMEGKRENFYKPVVPLQVEYEKEIKFINMYNEGEEKWK